MHLYIYCWIIWKNMNDIIFNGKIWNIHSLLSSVCRLIKDMEDLARTQETEKNESRRWIPPKGNLIKMNFNSAISTLKQKASMGIVIRNTKGEAITIRSKSRNICSPLQVESEAALLEIQTCIAIGAKRVIVEGDSKNVIEALKEPLEESPTEIRSCIAECK